MIHLFLCVHTQPQTHTHDVPGRCQIVFTFLRSLEKGEKEESEVNEDLSFIGERRGERKTSWEQTESIGGEGQCRVFFEDLCSRDGGWGGVPIMKSARKDRGDDK